MSSQSRDGEKKRFIFNRGTLKKAFIISAASVLLFSPAAPIFQNGQFLGFQDQTASAAGLAEVSILGSSTLVSNTGTPTSNGTILSPNLDGNYDVDLTFEGQALANVGLADPKVVVFSLPPELEGKVVGGATIDIDAKLLPITPGDLPAVSVLIGAVDTALNTLKAAATPLGVDLTSLTTAFGAIRNAQDLGSYQASLPGVVSADGKSISVDFTDGLGLFVRQAFVDTFQPLRDAVNQLSFPFPASITLNPLLAALKLALNPVFNLVDTLVEDSSGLLTNFLSVNLLAGTSYDVKFAVSKPDAAQATIHAAAVKNPIIDASLLGAINSEGANATLIFANPIWDNYVIPAPSVNQVYVGDAAITGTVALTNPIPPGSTFEAIVTLADGSTVTAPVNAVDGSFSIDVSGKTLTANDVLSTIIQGTNSGVPKDSLSTETTVLAVPNPEWDAYVVKEPTISPVHVGDTNVTGTVTLNTPIPAGTTFTAVVTLPDGSKVNAPVGVDGVITVPLNGYVLQAGDTLSTIIQATNNGATKDSTPTVSTVLPEVNTEWENYVVTPPVISDVTVGDTNVTGTVSLATPIPAGTTFEAIVTLPNGSQVTAPVGIDGVITVPLNGYVLAADDVLNTIIQATNAGETKDSTNVATTVKAVTWGTYTVEAPSLQPIFTTATAIDGTVTLATPIPLGATFEAIATLPNGSTVSVPVNGDGSFSLPLGGVQLAAGEQVSVIVQGTLNGETRDSQVITATVQAVSNPEWDNYVVAAPVLDPLRVNDASLTGNVTLNTPIPAGTTFTAQVTLPDGSTISGIVAPNGAISLNLNGYPLVVGDTLSVIVQAKNGSQGKNSPAVSVTVLPVLVDPEWTNYVVATPTINPVRVGDTTATGAVTLNTPIPAGTTFTAEITLPGGTVVTAPVNPDGVISVDLGGANLVVGDTLTTVIKAKNGTDGKVSQSVTTTVIAAAVDPEWTNYVVATPVITPVYDDATSVTGMVTLNTPIPVGTTFTAAVTLPNGSVVTAPVNPDGAITVDLGGYTLVAGDTLTTVLQAKNGVDGKNSPTVTTTVLARDTNPEWTNYAIVAPVIDPTYDGATVINGKVTLTTPIPVGSTFVAIVTLPNGTTATADVQPDGTISVTNLGGYVLQEGDSFTTLVQGTNNGVIKNSPTVTTVVQAEPGNTEWENYVVAAPVIDPVHVGDATVTGTVTLATPIPVGTTFEALVTLPDGSVVSAPVNGDGNISVPLNGYVLQVGDTLSTLVQATNNGETKNSNAITTTVLGPIVDPEWTNYVVANPVIAPVYDDATTVTGTVTLATPIPVGTTFSAIVTLPNGTKVSAAVQPDGVITVDLNGYVLVAGDQLSTVVEAKNGTDVKTSSSVGTTVLARDTNPEWTNYVVTAPTVNPIHVGDVALTGTVALAQPIPAGTTFTAYTILPDGSKVSAPVNPDGSISIDLTGKTLVAGDDLKTYIEATNGGQTKDSAQITTTVLAKEGNPEWDNYVVAAPVVDPIRAGATEITGAVTLNTPIPAGTTFTAIVTLPDGSTLTALVNPDGSITVDLGGKTLVAGDTVVTYVEAANAGQTKDSAQITSTVLPADGDTEWTNYIVATPTVNPVYEGDTTVTGTVVLNTPIPAGTTFVAIVTLPDGSTVSAPVNPDGTISVDLGGKTLVAGDTISTLVEATHGGETKDSSTVTSTVLPKVVDPWESYVVADPTINPVHADDVAVTGTVTLTQPIPDGTTFVAIVTLPDGTKLTGTVAADGTITVPLNGATLEPGDVISTIVQAQNDGKTKDSNPVDSTILDPTGESDWDKYIVATPVLDPIYVGATQITGKVTLIQPIPDGTTFKATLVLPNGTKLTGTIEADGTITVDLDGNILTAGDTITEYIEATNENRVKEGPSASGQVQPREVDPWENYVVKEPTINPVHAGDKTVTGSVTLNQPIPAGVTFTAVVTLPDGSQVSGTVAEDGTITVDLGDVVLKEGDTISTVVVAHRGDETKESTPVESTILPGEIDPAWANYAITLPSIDDVYVSDTKVTGKVQLNTPIPNGTTFKALITFADGRTETVDLADDGTFKIDWTLLRAAHALTEGDSITATIQGTNAENLKTGPTATTIVLADKVPTSEWDSYVVAPPTIDPVHAGDQTITGKVTFNTPIPAGTTFVANVTLPNGTVIEAPIAVDGSYKVTVTGPQLKVGEKVSATVQAKNGTETKDSSAVSTTVLAKTGGSNGGNNGNSGNGGNTGNTGNTGNSGTGATTTNYGNKTYSKSDTFPQAGETQNSVFGLLGVLAIGLAGLFLFSKKNRKMTK
ncbi:MAG: adhesive domain-containing protein [Carnobacterium maltaromaticum]